MQQVTQFT